MSDPTTDGSSAAVPVPPASSAPAAVSAEPMESDNTAKESQPAPATSSPSPKKPSSDRAADIARAVALGEKRAAGERANYEERMRRKDARIGISETAVREGAAKRELAREKKHAFRTETLKRRRELEADQRKKDEEEKRKQELERIHAAEKKKQDEYMQDIRVTAAAKIVIEQRLNQLKAEYATDRQHAEFDHRTALEQAHRKHADRCRETEKEAHERKNSLENELKTKLYQLEGWHRMQIQTQSTDAAHQLSALRTIRDPRAAERKAEEIRQDAYRKQRRLDSDWKDRKKALEQENLFKQNAARNDAQEARRRADNELREATHIADSALRHRMEELDIAFKVQKRRLRVAT